MHETIKYVWLCLAIFTVFGLLAMLPYGKWQKAYMREYHRIKNEPQRRIDAAYKYLEEVEDGAVNTDNGVHFEDYLKRLSLKTNYKNSNLPYKRYQRPLYVRDKHNPSILHPYRGK